MKAEIKFFFSGAKKSKIFIFFRGAVSISSLTHMPERKEWVVAAWGEGQVYFYSLVAFKRPEASFYIKPK